MIFYLLIQKFEIGIQIEWMEFSPYPIRNFLTTFNLMTNHSTRLRHSWLLWFVFKTFFKRRKKRELEDVCFYRDFSSRAMLEESIIQLRSFRDDSDGKADEEMAAALWVHIVQIAVTHSDLWQHGGFQNWKLQPFNETIRTCTYVIWKSTSCYHVCVDRINSRK